jgi:long-chain acyl-CoA synthetase
MDLLVNLRRTVRLSSDASAIVDGEVRKTWREYDQATRDLAAGLVALGARPGDRIAVLALNGYRYAELFYGVLRMGGIIVPLNTRAAPAEQVYTLNDSEATILFVDPTFLPMVQGIASLLPTVRHTILMGDGECLAGMHSYQAVLDAGKNLGDYQDVQPDEDDVTGLFYTGGTTGYPKGVMLTHKGRAAGHMQFLSTSSLPKPLRTVHVAPLFHIAGCSFFFTVTLLGGCHVFLPTFNPVQILETIQQERITQATLVPTMINALLQVPTIRDYDLSSLQHILYGASPMPLEVLKKAMSVFSCQFVQAYGLTEAGPTLTVLPWEAHLHALQAEPGSPEARRLTSAGQPLIGLDVRVVDEQGQEVAIGEVGEIVARGPNIMQGYWKMAEETAYGLRDGWLHTGDLATRDEQSFFYVVDRKKDMIVSGGENIYSAETENALYAHPAVLEAAVIGVPDSKWGERVHAVVVLKPGQHATEEELVACCRERIASYKVPRSLEFIDTLPKSAAGKILKRTLRDKYWQGQTRQVN